MCPMAPSGQTWPRLWRPNFVLSTTTITASAARIIARSVPISSKLLLNNPSSLTAAVLITVFRTRTLANISSANGPRATPERGQILPPINTRSLLASAAKRLATGRELVTMCNERPSKSRATSKVVLPPSKRTVSPSSIRATAFWAIARFSSQWAGCRASKWGSFGELPA